MRCRGRTRGKRAARGRPGKRFWLKTRRRLAFFLLWLVRGTASRDHGYSDRYRRWPSRIEHCTHGARAGRPGGTFGQGDPRPAPSRGSTGLAGVSTRPAGLPHPWGATRCREAAPLTYMLLNPNPLRPHEGRERHSATLRTDARGSNADGLHGGQLNQSDVWHQRHPHASATRTGDPRLSRHLHGRHHAECVRQGSLQRPGPHGAVGEGALPQASFASE